MILNDVRLHNDDVTDDDIFYVLTVPAIWSDAAKQFMREAATSKEVGIKDEQLKLVLEPEAASVYCRQTPSKAVRETTGELRLTSLPVGHKYVIVDLGGGTADIAIHQIEKDGRLHEVLNARGDDLGGQQFNKNFLDFLASIFGKEIIEAWKFSRKGHFLKLQRSIEGYKWDVSNNDEDIAFEVPQSLSNVFREKSGKNIEEVILEKTSFESVHMSESEEIVITNATVKSFFKSTLEGLQKHLLDIIQHTPELKTVFLVGGMAKSAYVREYIQKHFPNIRLIVPEDPGVAVLKGAVLLGNQPQIIAGRIARYSYGIRISKDFVEGKHREDYKFTIDGQVLCGHVFQKLIEKGNVLKFGDRFTTKTCINAKLPETKHKTFSTDLYQSTQPSPTYITEEGCTKLGGFQEKPPEGGWPDQCQSIVEIVVGEAEFKFYVREDLGREYETKVDFLKSS